MLADFSTVLGRLFSLPHSFLLLCTESTVRAGSSSEKNPVCWQPYWYLNCWTHSRCKTLVVSILGVRIHSAAIMRESSFRLLQMTFSAWPRISFELLLCCIVPKTSAWNSGRFLASWQKSHLFGPKFSFLVLSAFLSVIGFPSSLRTSITSFPLAAASVYTHLRKLLNT